MRGRLDSAGHPLDLCAACEAELPRAPALSDGSWDLLVAPFLYDTPIDYCVRALKFHGETAFGRLLGLLVAQERRRHDLPLPDLVLPVPLHQARYIERGFNQAAIIGRHAAGPLGLPFGPGVLDRRRATAEQSHLRGAARAGNVRGAFRLSPSAAVAGRSLALVDDVLTTGSTAREATKVLRAAGAARVELWVAAGAAPASAAIDVIEQDADEDRHADVVVVEEGAEAGRGLAVADDPLLPEEEQGRGREPRAIPRAELHAAPREV